jgi:hypothetical protein
MAKDVLVVDTLSQQIHFIRGQRVMLDSDLARLYEVSTRVFNQAVKRNEERFPEDFVFQLTKEETLHLRSQIVTSNRGGRRYLPYVFTEHGALMLASVLRSKHAVEMSILIVRAFVQLRFLLSTHKELAQQVKKLERRLDFTDESVAELYALIQKLTSVPSSKKPKIGFRV